MLTEPHRSIAEVLRDHFIGAITFDFTRYLVAAGVLSLLLVMLGSWSVRRRIQLRRQASAADYRRELGSSLRTVLLFAVTTLTTLAMQASGFLHLTKDGFAWGTFALQLGAIVLAHDAYFYWMHRALHHRRLFRATHLHHHLSLAPTPWTAYSFSVWEAIFEAAFVPLFLFLCALAGVDFLIVTIVVFLNHQIIRNVMGHAGVELFPRFWVDNRWTDWITTTTHHDLHHSEGRYNFGLYFTWWDRLMGTEHPRYKERFREVTNRAPQNLQADPA